MKTQIDKFVLIVASLAILQAGALAQASGTWTVTGPVAKAATNASATLMRNGKVLVAGAISAASARCSRGRKSTTLPLTPGWQRPT